MGVWIETYELRNALDYGTSHPAWVCGLKQLKKKIPVVMFVTPCVGVWIETNIGYNLRYWQWVTPCVGVWIETSTIG